MSYVATINTPGYLPHAEPAEFDTPAEAWQYLADDRREHEDSEGDGNYSETVDELDAKAAAGAGPGVVYGNTPGYTGVGADLGFAYEVQQT